MLLPQQTLFPFRLASDVLALSPALPVAAIGETEVPQAGQGVLAHAGEYWLKSRVPVQALTAC